MWIEISIGSGGVIGVSALEQPTIRNESQADAYDRRMIADQVLGGRLFEPHQKREAMTLARESAEAYGCPLLARPSWAAFE